MYEATPFALQDKVENIITLLETKLRPGYVIDTGDGHSISADRLIDALRNVVVDDDTQAMEKVTSIFRELTKPGSDPLDPQVLALQIAQEFGY